MDCSACYFPVAATSSFTPLVNDYVQEDPFLRPFYNQKPDIDGIRQIIRQREKTPIRRDLLVQVLEEQYRDLPVSDAVRNNIRRLGEAHTFTVCTAHQPNLMTGYLYFTYKILHAVQLAARLKRELPEYAFVPVFYMGSEDNDLDELNRFVLDGDTHIWNTPQQGAVGRMKVDASLLQLINRIEGQLTVLPYGKELMRIIRDAYREGGTVAEATLRLANSLYGEYGLVVLIADHPLLKQLMIPVFREEMLQHSAYSLVEETSHLLSPRYKVQVNPREINLFYLTDEMRERIERNGSGYRVLNSDLHFSEQELLTELQENPARFSPNVVLRGLYQESILPDVAFIGGGSELAYWLELKGVFDHYGVPFPALVLRNSFILLAEQDLLRWQEMGFSLADIFSSEEELFNRLVERETTQQVRITEEQNEAGKLYEHLRGLASSIDPTLGPHVEALQSRAQRQLVELEKKMLRAEKRKYEARHRHLKQVRSRIFPSGKLQERVENILPFYARLGPAVLQEILEHSLGLEQQFCVLTYKSA